LRAGIVVRFIERTARGGILSVLSFLTHNPTGIGIAVFAGTILVLFVMAFFETRPATRPQLTIPFEHWRGAGLYELQDRLIGWELAIRNSETRFHTIANNVRGKITFRHILGNEVVANPAIWLQYGPPRLRSAEQISIEMGETARLLVCVARNDAMDRYYASPPWPLQLDANHRLDFGQWHVEIELSGDNVNSSYEGTLTLNANGDVNLDIES
jgi:hypothetical protein